jgi:hypothetical protein
MSLPCRSLPCRSLPCRSLPCRALTLIRDYSRPMTRPDWRQSKPIITTYDLYLHVKYINPNDLFPPTELLHRVILHNILITDWYFNYYIKKYGLSTFKQ